MTMTAEQLEELLGKVTQGDWQAECPDDGDAYYIASSEVTQCKETAVAKLRGDQYSDASLIALAPSLARRVLAAEKMVAELELILENDDDHWSMFKCALTAYREASK